MMAQRIKQYFKSKANTFDIAVKRTYTSLSSIAGIILRATSFKICALKTGIPPPLCAPLILYHYQRYSVAGAIRFLPSK